MEQEMTKDQNILVYRARIAKGLLKKGHQIVDIAPYREDRRRSVFYFAYDDTIYQDLDELTRPIEDESAHSDAQPEEPHAD